MITAMDLDGRGDGALAAYLDQVRSELQDGPAPTVETRLAVVLRDGLGGPPCDGRARSPRRTGAVEARTELSGRWRRARVALALVLAGGAALGTGAAGALPEPAQSVFDRATAAVGLGEVRPEGPGPAPTSNGERAPEATPLPLPRAGAAPDAVPGHVEATDRPAGPGTAPAPSLTDGGGPPAEGKSSAPPEGMPTSRPTLPPAASPAAGPQATPDLPAGAPGLSGAPPPIAPGDDGDYRPGPPDDPRPQSPGRGPAARTPLAAGGVHH